MRTMILALLLTAACTTEVSNTDPSETAIAAYESQFGDVTAETREAVESTEIVRMTLDDVRLNCKQAKVVGCAVSWGAEPKVLVWDQADDSVLAHELLHVILLHVNTTETYNANQNHSGNCWQHEGVDHR